jgi:tripartite-type tricarboxylate transporter receptor subunit TctC
MEECMKRIFFALFVLTVFSLNGLFAGGGSEGGAQPDGAAAATGPAWPDEKLITIIVPVNVGGNIDVKARFFAKYLPKYMPGVNVVVENKGGAAGITALTEYLSESPDTSKILYMAGSHSVITPFYNDTRYTKDDFVPLYGTDEVENGLFVNPDKTGIRTMADLIAYGKGKTVKFGSSATGDTFMITKALLTMAGLKSDVVASNSAPEYLVNCLAGTVDIAYAGMNIGKSYVDEGKLWPLGAFTEEPYTAYKGVTVPTFKSQGYDIVFSAFSYFAIRKGTSEAVIKLLEDVFTKIGQDPEFRKEFAAAGFVQVKDTSAAAVQRKMDKLSNDIVMFDSMIK